MRLPAAPALLLVMLSSGARADDVTFARGGPSSASAKQAVASAVASSRGDMLPCWRRGASAVDVAVTTDAAGAVTSATARTDGAAAQCVAGILAVAMMPRSAGAWSGVLTILPPSSGGGGGGGAGGGGANAGDDVNGAIAKHAAELRACQKADPKAAGIVEIDLRVHPDGSLTDITVARSLSPALDACLTKLLAKTKLDDYHGKEVHYRLGLSYAGGDSGGGYQPPSAPEHAPTTHGALTAEQITPIVDGAERAIDGCGKDVKPDTLLVIRFTVRKDGSVKNLGVKESHVDKKVEACVLEVVSKLRFPTAGDETQVQYPLDFSR